MKAAAALAHSNPSSSATTAPPTVPVEYAEKTMGSLMKLHGELMEEKERRVDLYRRLMEKEQTLAELRMYVKLLEERLNGPNKPESAPAPPPPVTSSAAAKRPEPLRVVPRPPPPPPQAEASARAATPRPPLKKPHVVAAPSAAPSAAPRPPAAPPAPRVSDGWKSW